MLANKTILIVEDIDSCCELIEEMLSELEVTILVAKDGISAVNMCESNPSIDIVLMDILIPKLNGHEATRQIKKIRKDLPVLVQTSYAMDGDEIKARQAGCDAYLTKPLNRIQLVETIQKLLT